MLIPEPTDDPELVGNRRKLLAELRHCFVERLRAAFTDNQVRVPPGLKAVGCKKGLGSTTGVSLTMYSLETQKTNLKEKGITVRVDAREFQDFRKRLRIRETEDRQQRQLSGGKRPCPGF